VDLQIKFKIKFIFYLLLIKHILLTTILSFNISSCVGARERKVEKSEDKSEAVEAEILRERKEEKGVEERNIQREKRVESEEKEKEKGIGEAKEREKENTCSNLWKYDEVLGWRNSENCRMKVPEMLYFPSFYVETNSEGFRDKINWGENMEYWKKSGKRRILLLGDSVCFGFGLNFEETMGEILEVLLKDRFVVLNTSVVGYAIDQETILLEREGIKYSPDYVVYCVWVNDLSCVLDSKPLENGRGKPVFILKDGELEIKNVPVKDVSLFPERYKEMFKLLYGRYALDIYEGKNPSKLFMGVDFILRKITSKFPVFQSEIVKYTVSLIREIIRRGKNACGCNVIVLLIPDYHQARGLNPYADLMYDRIQKEINFAKVIKINLGENEFFKENLHPNGLGHRKIAEILAKTIENMEATELENQNNSH